MNVSGIQKCITTVYHMWCVSAVDAAQEFWLLSQIPQQYICFREGFQFHCSQFDLDTNVDVGGY